MSNKFSSALVKAKNSFSKMPRGKKIYAYLWMATAGLLIVCIGLFVGFSSSSTQHNKDGSWKIVETKNDKSKVLSFKDSNNDGVIHQNDGDKITFTDSNGKEHEIAKFVKYDGSSWVPTDVENLTKVDFENFTKGVYSSAWNSKQPADVKVTLKDDEQVAPGDTLATNLGDAVKQEDAKKIYTVDAPKLDANVTTYYNVDDQGNYTQVTDKKDSNKSLVLKQDLDLAKVDTTFIFASYNDGKNDVDAVNPNLPATDKQVFVPLTSWVSYDFDTFKQGTLTTDAAQQQNIIAAFGGLFAISTTAAIFTTATVELLRKKRQVKAVIQGGKE